ncbi:MAG: hypothetical protein E6J79_07560 [Deltaproteobacteria bacterium]|nr:MAG: hypothetical protein E6J79_07560 [Deltaproteobacteria bacterium]
MTIAVGTAQDPVLEPVGAPSRIADSGVEATRAALDQQQVEGREAVQLVDSAAAGPDARPVATGTPKGQLVDRRA